MAEQLATPVEVVSKPRKGILVLGMHRSGTSALTRLLNLVGARLGSDLLPPLAENPEGFWESESVMRLGDQALSQAGSWWHDWGALAPDALDGEPGLGLKSRLKGLIEGDFGDAPLFAIKDPRTCRLLPLWSEVLAELGVGIGAVHVVRQPHEVAASLARRNGFHTFKSLLLWLRYVLDAERGSRDMPRVFTSYQGLLDDWRLELGRVSDGLGLGLRDPSPSVVAEIERFLRPDLRHHALEATAPDQGDEPDIEVWSRRVYSVLSRFSNDGEDAAGIAELDAVHYALDRASRTFAPAARSDALALFAVERQMEELQAQAALEAAKLQEHRAWIDHLDGQLAQRAASIQVVKGQLAESIARGQGLEHEVVAGLSRILVLEAGLAEQAALAQSRADQIRHMEDTLGWRLLQGLYYRPERRIKLLLARLGLHSPLDFRPAGDPSDAASPSAEPENSVADQSQVAVADNHHPVPLRAGVSMLRKARRVSYRLLMRAFQGLPMGARARYRLKSAIYRRVPRLVAGLPDYQQWRQAIEASALEVVAAPGGDPVRHAAPRGIEPLTLLRPEDCAPETIRLPEADQPLVSVVIPVYNKLDYTLCCLASVARSQTRASFEVIVVDDGSTDSTPEALGAIPHLNLIVNQTNLGFLRTVNRGAAAARGRYLLVLNNDTQVRPGWMDALLEVFRADPLAGLVGSKLVYPSGHLQEAGACLRADGTVDLVGLTQDPADPRFNQLREMDHVSAASVLIERGLFESLGGLDERYAPAYYEDCDLSLRVRAAGRKVIYQPASEVIHHLSVTTNEYDQGKSAQIERNRSVYLATWGEELQRRDQVRAIALFLPQYHPIPENDLWWGKGFTEWTNVTRARPIFSGHHQPRLPADLGFYDLRVPEVRSHQADLARAAGLHGFCYYYYWFGGKRLLDRPLDDMLESGVPDLPFCLCWANENWTRRWDGKDSEILIAQDYSPSDDLAFIQSLIPFFRDPRYIRIDGRPVLLLYRASLLPDVAATAARWRGLCREDGIGELYLVAVQSFYERDDPRGFGFDAAVQFPPHGLAVRSEVPQEMLIDPFKGIFFDYRRTADAFIRDQAPGYTLFKAAMPSWDNTARRQDSGHIFVGSTPEEYSRWLKAIVDETRATKQGEERILFVNAWNEWAEGNYLEPDNHHGHDYLKATAAALAPVPAGPLA